jgi:hypothetical protein
MEAEIIFSPEVIIDSNSIRHSEVVQVHEDFLSEEVF